MSNADESGEVEQLADHSQLLAPEVSSLQFRYFDGTDWLEVWDGFMGVLTDSLLVEGVAGTAGDVIFAMFAGNEQVAKSVVGGEPLKGIMEDIFKEEGGELCKENFVQLLTRIAGFSPSGCKYVEELLELGGDVVKGDDDLLNLQADLRR